MLEAGVWLEFGAVFGLTNCFMASVLRLCDASVSSMSWRDMKRNCVQ